MELQEARHHLSTVPTIKAFALEKHRKQGSSNGCSIELTHIQLDGTDREYWSVCIEGRESRVQQLLRKRIQHEGREKTVEEALLGLLEDGTVQGYPEMIAKL